MKEIKLTQGKVAIVDDEDYERINKHKWCCIGGYAGRNINGKHYYLHWEIIGKPKKGLEIDHTNKNKLDNRKSNLRICNRSQNNRNVFTNKSNKSGYKGVIWLKQNKKWMAQITFNYKRIYLGLFTNKLDAAKAYNDAARRYHKEFSSLNLV